MAFDPTQIEVFRYVGTEVDPAAATVRCTYALGDDLEFTEALTIEGTSPADWDTPAVHEAARLYFLLAGVSYYKAAAPPVIDLGDTPVRDADRALLRPFYLDGLGEYAYRNGLDLTGLTFTGGRPAGPAATYASDLDLPLIPFGGGIDSIVTVESLRDRVADPALFVLGRGGTRFAAIEDAAAVTKLPVLRADQRLDEQILRSDELGFRNGHVPVTGVLSAIALLTAVLHGRGAVVMSNEHSSSIGNLEVGGREVNHQWSKSMAFEQLFRGALASALDEPPAYYSYLRGRSELWVAERFAALERYHGVFRSCNRAFAIDPTRRLAEWCGVCDKCVFIDLVLAPFLSREQLRAIFGGTEPLDRDGNEEPLRALVGTSEAAKPFECVGDIDECRVAARLAADRPDRADQDLLQRVTGDLPADPDQLHAAAATMRDRLGPDLVPDAHAS